MTRLRPELRAAFTAWLATKPLENANALAHPLVMGEYVSKVLLKFDEDYRRLVPTGTKR